MAFRNRRIKEAKATRPEGEESDDDSSSEKRDQSHPDLTALEQGEQTVAGTASPGETVDAVFLFKSFMNKEDSKDINLMKQSLKPSPQRAEGDAANAGNAGPT